MTTRPDPIHVALVGHCGPDAWALRAAVGRALPGARFESISSDRDLGARAGPSDLLLVNRALDGQFQAADGIELIRALAQARQGSRPALLLVSNYPDAQAAAVAAGALPGFGKKELDTPLATDRLRAAVEQMRPVGD